MRALLFILLLVVGRSYGSDYRGAQFVGFEQLEKFEIEKDKDGATILSKRVEPEISWNELVVSWNFRSAPTNGLKIEARAVFGERESGWYNLASWALEPSGGWTRQSEKGQSDADGRVDTDTLKLKEHAKAVRLRIQLSPGSKAKDLRFLGLAFCDSEAERSILPANKAVWGKILQVKERTQADYPEGISEWCSPTSMSMLMSFWAAKLNRTDLEYDVPEVARGVHDPSWPGTGNWPFNTAFAGAHDGMRAYVARFSDVSELEDWVEAGIPVAISVSYGYLKGQPERANGHLVVCIGFDENGNIVVNDPGRRMVRQVYLRENLIKGWAESENTVYIVHPEQWKLPKDRFGHWFAE